jgi:SWI/SNF-related matrix-associated actin-dependent regulator 1 of chromatin subfamily A|tara:strand:- start:527 stop:2245 length:1719 start_codon:yes stop_codon:yes gene_type:complete
MSELELYPFQKEDVTRVKDLLVAKDRPAILLAHEMGCGKTLIAITSAVECGFKNVLVLCPSSVRFVWAEEANKWHGIQCNCPETIAPGEPTDGWNVVSTSVIANDKHEPFRRRNWDCVIIDECHIGGFKAWNPNLADGGSVTATRFFGEGGLRDHAEKIMFLSGTPMPNYPKELWAMCSVLIPEDRTCKDRNRFVGRYCRGGFTGDTGSCNLDELRNKMRPFIIRRRKSSVLKDLPPKTIKVVELPATDEVKRVLNYETGELQSSKDTIEKIKDRMAAAKEVNSIAAFKAAQGNLREAKSIAHKRLVAIRAALSIPKVPLITEYVRLLLSGGSKKVVVFFWHSAHGKELAKELDEYGVITIDGSVPSSKRGGLVHEFQEGKPRVFLGQIKAAGVGLTLTAASDVVCGEADWVPGNMAQACNRTHRPGQENPVTIHMLCVEGSPDAMVYRSLARKMENIFTAIDGRVGKSHRKTWLGKGIEPSALGRKMSNDQCAWAQRELLRMVAMDDSGSISDGKGLSSAFILQSRRLTRLRAATRQQYGEMALILCRFPTQVDIPPWLVKLARELQPVRT